MLAMQIFGAFLSLAWQGLLKVGWGWLLFCQPVVSESTFFLQHGPFGGEGGRGMLMLVSEAIQSSGAPPRQSLLNLFSQPQRPVSRTPSRFKKLPETPETLNLKP